MKTLTISILVGIIFLGCQKFIEIDNPIDKITSTKVFNDSSTATAAMVGIYTKMGSVGLRIPIISTGAVTIYTGLTSDELLYTGNTTTEMEFLNNSISTNNNIIASDIWRYGYSFIYQTNAVIDGIEKSSSLPANVANQLIGEAKFLRAYLHFYLVNLFGDVPLVITSDYNVNSALGRTPISQVYHQIIDDLKEAREKLPATYPSAHRARANKWAAAALLARTYLFIGDYQHAEQEASDLINSGVYSIESDLSSVFTNSSNETIWQLIPFATSLSTIEGFNFIPSSSATKLPIYPIRTELLNAFVPGDERKTEWIGSKTVASQTYYYPKKYRVRAIAAGTPQPEYHVLLRLAEIFLIRAEARAQQENNSGAMADLNHIRNRAGLEDLPENLSKTELLQAIANERRCELFAECGHRWLDLKRRKEADSILSPLKPDWQASDTLFPIPQAEILSNPKLSQNPGY